MEPTTSPRRSPQCATLQSACDLVCHVCDERLRHDLRVALGRPCCVSSPTQVYFSEPRDRAFTAVSSESGKAIWPVRKDDEGGALGRGSIVLGSRMLGCSARAFSHVGTATKKLGRSASQPNSSNFFERNDMARNLLLMGLRWGPGHVHPCRSLCFFKSLPGPSCLLSTEIIATCEGKDSTSTIELHRDEGRRE